MLPRAEPGDSQEEARLMAPAPSVGVALELARALGGLALLPPRALRFVAERADLRAEVRADLSTDAAPSPVPDRIAWPDRPLRVFVSCAEPSGEIHALRLVDALRRVARAQGAPEPELAGLGGPRLANAGVAIVGDPVSRAAMGFRSVLGALPFYLRLLRDAVEHMQRWPADLFVPIDSPALHVPLGRLARRARVPVAHFVTPQYWGWAPWRARGYRSAVDLALTILPFEPPWFARRGIRARHVGHPLLDSLPARAEPAGERNDLVLLPGSRRSVVERNLPWMLRIVRRWRESFPDARIVLPHGRPELAPALEACIERAGASEHVTLVLGDLHGAPRGPLSRARAALSVSGTVLLDLLHERVPTVVIYKLEGPLQTFLADRFLLAPWFASVNLLAGEEVLPEYRFHGDGPVEEVAAALERAYADEKWRERCFEGLERAARRLGPPGACDRAALQALGCIRSAESVPCPAQISTRESR